MDAGFEPEVPMRVSGSRITPGEDEAVGTEAGDGVSEGNGVSPGDEDSDGVTDGVGVLDGVTEMVGVTELERVKPGGSGFSVSTSVGRNETLVAAPEKKSNESGLLQTSAEPMQCKQTSITRGYAGSVSEHTSVSKTLGQRTYESSLLVNGNLFDA